MLEQFARVVVIADCRERIDVPEGADEKRSFRTTEVILLRVAVDEIPAPQVAADDAHGTAKARIIRSNESKRKHQQQACIESIAFHGRRKCTEMVVPGATGNGLVNMLGAVTPMRCFIAEAQALRDVGKVIAPSPAHHAREG